MIQETPADLIVNCQPQAILAALQKIATVNGREHQHGLTLEEVTLIKEEYDCNQRSKQTVTVRVLDLLRFPSLRWLTIVNFLLQFTLSY